MGIGLFAPPFGVGYYAACAISRIKLLDAAKQADLRRDHLDLLGSSNRGGRTHPSGRVLRWPMGSRRPAKLLFSVRKDKSMRAAATKQLDGQISKKLSSPWLKNIPLNPSGKSALPLRASHPTRGALRTSRTRGGMRWTRIACEDERKMIADGEVVWSWRPDAGAKFAGSSPAGDGGKKARSPRRARSKP